MNCTCRNGLCPYCKRPCYSDGLIRQCNQQWKPYTECRAGNALKELIAGWPLYIEATPECHCAERAEQMNVNGCQWCEENVDTITGWLREEAKRRGLPFLDAVGRLLVRRAIRNARRAASTAENTQS